MSRADEFRKVFNILEQTLKDRARADNTESISAVVNRLSKSDRVINRFRRDIRQFIELRNAIIHQSTDRPIAEPYQDTIDALRNLTNNIVRPMTARDIASKPVKICKLDDELIIILKKMQHDNLTNIPVIDDRKIIGVLSETSVMKWVVNESREDGIVSTATKVSDIIPYLDDKKGDKYTGYLFMEPNTDVYSIENAFSEDIARNKRLAAIFVTAKGTADEIPIGVITAWDMSKVGRTR